MVQKQLDMIIKIDNFKWYNTIRRKQHNVQGVVSKRTYQGVISKKMPCKLWFLLCFAEAVLL
jgi:hypothetical protein